jgi:hypothetical protein
MRKLHLSSIAAVAGFHIQKFGELELKPYSIKPFNSLPEFRRFAMGPPLVRTKCQWFKNSGKCLSELVRPLETTRKKSEIKTHQVYVYKMTASLIKLMIMAMVAILKCETEPVDLNRISALTTRRWVAKGEICHEA